MTKRKPARSAEIEQVTNKVTILSAQLAATSIHEQ
jgi:hypothetical protein